MGLLLAISKIYIPPFIRKRKLEELFKATAEGFSTSHPSIRGLSCDDSLKLYAGFTRNQAETAIRQGRRLETRSRLFQSAYRLGRKIRADFNIRTPEEVMQMGTIIYRLLKIDFQGDSAGKIEIKSCFFSVYYSRDICRLISALDEGLLAGLSAGGRLTFSQRITEGNRDCLAGLEFPGRAE